ncbi:MAG: glycosyltransferase family 1 protein [Cyanobacteria bacterium P01_A01_bin.17]
MYNNRTSLKILLYGNAPLSIRRSQILMQHLFAEFGHQVSHVSPGFYSPSTQATGSFTAQSGFAKKMLTLLSAMELLVKASFADVIYLMPTNAYLIQPVLWATKLFNLKLIVEVYLSTYDSLVRDRNLVPEDSLAAQTAKQKDQLALSQADYIIHTGRHELAYWEKILDLTLDEHKILIAPLSFSPEITSQRYFCEDGIFRVCWWGTFIPLHGLDKILEAAQILQQQSSIVEWVLFGVDNEFYTLYADEIQQRGLTHVKLRKDLTFADGSLPAYLTQFCDLSLGIFGETQKARYAVPNKLIEALAMGIPTLTMKSAALSEFFDPEADFWTCEPQGKAIAQMVLQVLQGKAPPVNWEQTRQKVLQTFSVSQYQQIVSDAIAKATFTP